MSVKFNNNYNPSFKMAMRKPKEKHLKNLIEFTKMNENPVVIKGYRQLEQEMSKLKRFDIEYVNEGAYIDKVNIIDNSTNTVVETMDGVSLVTGLNYFGAVNYPGKKLIAALFNPKKYLPYNFLNAAERAKELEANAIKQEAIIKQIL